MAVDDFAAQLARERALKQAEKMETIGRLTGAIAQQFHELLSVILARSATLAKSLPPNRDLDELNATAQRGAELAQRLLGFSRHRVLDLQPLILTEFVRAALDALGRQLPAGIEVQFAADEDAGVVEADPAAVKQILLHLVTNARDAMSKGGTLHQHLPEVVGHGEHRRVVGSFVDADHDVHLVPGSLAARAAGAGYGGTKPPGLEGDGRTPEPCHIHVTKSHHHQGVDRLGEGLVVTGRSMLDDLPEAVEIPDRRFALGVQWHPEADERSRLISALVEEAAAARVA